jgi:SAM-dependent methyltransferase
VSEAEFAAPVADPGARKAGYEPMVRAYYERVTDIYRQYWGDSFHFAIFRGDESLAEALQATEDWLGERAGFRPGLEVLDVGCGVAGPALRVAESFGARVTGLNLSEAQVRIARERVATRGRAREVRLVVADGMRMPFADGAFDGVYVFEAGCHMPDKTAFARECARVLRRGGVFVGLDWMRGEGLGADAVSRYVEPICRFHSLPDLGTLTEFGAGLVAAGLEVEDLASAADFGDILRNWELLDDKTVAAFRDLAPEAVDPTLRFVTEGGIALAEAARAGAFVLGHWRARRL